MPRDPTPEELEYQTQYSAYEKACLELPLDKLDIYLKQMDFSFFKKLFFRQSDYNIPFGKICLNNDWPRIDVFIQTKSFFPDETALWSHALFKTVSHEMYEFLPFFYNHPDLNFKASVVYNKRYEGIHLGFSRGICYSREAMRFMHDWLTEHNMTALLDKTKQGVLQERGEHKGRVSQPINPERAYFGVDGIQMAIEELHITGLEPGLGGIASLTTWFSQYPTHYAQFVDTLQSNRDKLLLDKSVPFLGDGSALLKSNYKNKI